jgi:hypothetical protein
MRIERNNLTAVTESDPKQAMSQIPDVRAEKVARGKALVSDPNYPSKEQIKKIASLLAANLKRGNSSSHGPAFFRTDIGQESRRGLPVAIVLRDELAHG